MRNLTCLIVVLFLSQFLFAKTGTISGTVTNSQSGDPLIGANILVVNIMSGTVTDNNGYFEIKKLPSGIYSLKVSFVGYQTVNIKEVKVGSNKVTELAIKISPSSLEVNEVTISAE